MTTRRSVAAIAFATFMLAAAPASAQTVDRGATTLTVTSKSLAQSGIRLTAAKPATFRKGRLTLPISRGILSGGNRYLEHSGSVTFSRRAGGKTRRVVVRSLRTRLGRTASVSGRAGGKRVTLFTLSGRAPRVNAAAGTVALTATKATMSSRLAVTLRRSLRVKRLSRSLGRVAIEGALRGAATSTTTPSGGGGTTTATPAPAPAPPPATGTTVTSPTITWHVRDSLIRYLASSAFAQSDGTIVRGGATEGAATVREGSSEPLVYDFTFAPSGRPSFLGTPLSAFYGDGSLEFSYPEHGGLQIISSAPEIELNGAASRGIFTLDGNSVAAASRGGRTVLMTLDASAVTPTEAPAADGTRVTYERIPAKVSEEGSVVLQGYYQPGEDFGSITVSYTK